MLSLLGRSRRREGGNRKKAMIGLLDGPTARGTTTTMRNYLTGRSRKRFS
jgi:hypothetical protein